MGSRWVSSLHYQGSSFTQRLRREEVGGKSFTPAHTPGSFVTQWLLLFCLFPLMKGQRVEQASVTGKSEAFAKTG